MFVPQEGIDKLRYAVDIAGNSVLSGAAVSGDRLTCISHLIVRGAADKAANLIG